MPVKILSQSHLKSILHYDPLTGLFTWRVRPLDYAETPAKMAHWNRRYANKIVGTVVGNGYLYVSINKRRYSLHRLSFLYIIGRFPIDQADHLDHNRKNNRWSDLREASNAENHKNMKLPSNNKSGFSGVHWDKSRSKWLVGIGGKYVGRFSNKSDAISARKAAEIELGYHSNHGH